jgi:predicted dehydrogenase
MRFDDAEGTSVDYGPSFPAGFRPGIGIIGCGNVVKSAHLPAYAHYGLDLVGVYDVLPEATRGVGEEFGVRIFASLDELLAHPQIAVVDIATHPTVRPQLVRSALDAGKHVLSQKPFAAEVGVARGLIDQAERRGLKLAVNQNGRWTPAWRAATVILQRGAIGDVTAVTHLYDHSFAFTVGTVFDSVPHLVIYDYSVHWIDITRCWLEGHRIASVRAREYRTPNQPPETAAPWGAWVTIDCEDGTSAFIRSVGCSRTASPSKPFWIHGTEGTIRGKVIGSGPVTEPDELEVERDGERHRYELDGRWNREGFAGSMGELLTAIAEDREPYNSARHNLLSLELTLAACRSAEQDARPVRVAAR